MDGHLIDSLLIYISAKRHKRRKLLVHIINSKMALSSVLQSESADFSFGKDGSFGYGCGRNDLDESLNFAVRASMNPVDEEGPERKIEFLHGTTTLAFKVSCTTIYLA